MFRSSVVQLSAAFSRTHSADVRRLCTVEKKKRKKKEPEERDGVRQREKEEKTLTFCGFLGMCQSPRIPHIWFQLRLNPSLNQKVFFHLKRGFLLTSRLKQL